MHYTSLLFNFELFLPKDTQYISNKFPLHDKSEGPLNQNSLLFSTLRHWYLNKAIKNKEQTWYVYPFCPPRMYCLWQTILQRQSWLERQPIQVCNYFWSIQLHLSPWLTRIRFTRISVSQPFKRFHFLFKHKLWSRNSFTNTNFASCCVNWFHLTCVARS